MIASGEGPIAGISALPDLTADRAHALALTHVSRETLVRLDRFVTLLLATQSHTNLIGPRSVAEVWTRHIADSLQLLGLAPQARVWLDLGSGGGFPGVPIACALADRPGSAVHLVESTGKKAAFLREVCAELALPATVHHARIEALSLDADPDVVTARALAVEAELTEATKYWNIQAELAPSRTNPASRIVIVRGLQRRSVRS